MSGSNLKATGTELYVNIIILNYRYHAVYQRNNNLVALEPAVLGIGRVDAHCGITHYGLGTCGGNYSVVALGILVYNLTLGTCRLNSLLVCNVVLQVVQLAVLLLIDHLLITQSGLSLGIPVNHTYAAVDKTFVVQVNEHLDHALRAQVIHGESGTVPVTAAAQTAQLLEYYASVLLFPLPRVLKELITGQVSFLYSLGGKLTYNLGLGSYRCVIGSGYPKSVLAHHAGTTYQNVLNGVVKHMAHMQHTGHVWWRNDYGIRLTAVGL